MEEQLADFIEQHLGRYRPVLDALAGGTDVAPEELRSVFGDRNDFTRLRACHLSPDVHDPLLRRQAAILYRLYLPHQVESALETGIAAAGDLARAAREHVRIEIDGQQAGWAGFAEILRTSRSPARRLLAWNGVRAGAEAAAPHLLRLVELRNRAARDLGFDNHLDLALEMADIDRDRIETLAKDLKAGSGDAFRAARHRIGRETAALFRMKSAALRPWHFADPFRTRPLLAEEADPPAAAALAGAAATFLRRFGLEAKSEAGPRRTPPKAPWDRLAAFVRALHERIPHAAQALADPALPPLLRLPGHPILLFAVEDLLLDEIGAPGSLKPWLGTASRRASVLRQRLAVRRHEDLVLSLRFAPTAWHFARELYRHPGQDLAALWSHLVREAMDLDCAADAAAPLWAAVPGLAEDPVSLLHPPLGLLAAEEIRRSFPLPRRQKSLLRDADALRVVREQVLLPGAARSWTDTLQRIAGRPPGADLILARAASRNLHRA